MTAVANRGASVWVLVHRIPDHDLKRPGYVMLYHGRDAMDLKLKGQEVDPVYRSDGPIPDWDEILSLIAPI